MNRITEYNYSTDRLYGLVCPKCGYSSYIHHRDDMVQCHFCGIEGDEDEFVLLENLEPMFPPFVKVD